MIDPDAPDAAHAGGNSFAAASALGGVPAWPTDKATAPPQWSGMDKPKDDRAAGWNRPWIEPEKLQAGAGASPVEVIATELSNRGWSENAILAALHGAKSESNFDHRTSHFDQPNYRGRVTPRGTRMENAYGLWQYGGPNVPTMERFLDQHYPGKNVSRDFLNDPKMQAHFLDYDLRRDGRFDRINNAKDPKAAAVDFLGYLAPAENFRRQRANEIMTRGVPKYWTDRRRKRVAEMGDAIDAQA